MILLTIESLEIIFSDFIKIKICCSAIP